MALRYTAPPCVLFLVVEFQSQDAHVPKMFKTVDVRSIPLKDTESRLPGLSSRWREFDAKAKAIGRTGSGLAVVICRPVQGVSIEMQIVPIMLTDGWEARYVPYSGDWRQALMDELNGVVS